RLKFLEIVLVYSFLVAELEVAQLVGPGMTVGGSSATPLAGGRAVNVFDEVGQVLGRLIHVQRRDAQKPGRLAKVQKVQDAPTVRGIRIPGAPIRGPPVARSDHLLPAVFRMVDQGAAVA